MNKYGIKVGDRFLLPFRYVYDRNCCPTENNDFAIVKQRCETRVEVFCDQNEQFVYYDWIVTDYCPVFTVVGFLKSDRYEDVVYVKYKNNSETFMCQMLTEFVCKNGTRMNESDLKDYKNS